MVVKNKYEYNFSKETVIEYLKAMKNSIYKLLPLREEGGEWKKYLESLLELELKGCESLFGEIEFISLIAKLNSLNDKNFYLYRKGIFESLKIVDKMIEKLNAGDEDDK